MTENISNEYVTNLEECIAEIESVISEAAIRMQQNNNRKIVFEKNREEELAKARENALLNQEKNLENNARQIEELNQMKNAVIKNGRIISNHTSARFDPNKTEPVEPDLQYLKKSAFRIIDNDEKEDPLAAQLLKTCTGYLVWIDRRIEILQLGTMTSSSVEDSEQEIKNRFAGEVEEIIREEHEIHENLIKRLCNKPLLELKELLSSGNRKNFITLGYRAWRSKLPKLTDILFSKVLSGYVESDGTLKIPLLLGTNKPRPVFIEWQQIAEPHMSRMIQKLCLDWIRLYGSDNSEIYYLDQINRSARFLGPLSIVAGEQGCAIKAVPVSDDEMRSSINNLEKKTNSLEIEQANSYFSEIDKKNGPQKQSHILVIINDGQANSIDSFGRGIIQRLIYNGCECGIQFLWAHQSFGMDMTYGKNWITEVEYMYPNSIRINSNSENDSGFIALFENKNEEFIFEEKNDQISREELMGLVHRSDNIKFENTVYFERYPLHLPQRMQSSSVPIEVPIGIEDDGTPVFINFDGVNFATYIMGASGSGKSTLLHTIIAGLAMNYHPDDLEIWLADFNRVEFGSYIRHPLPHIRHILLDDSRELVFDLIDHLIDEMDRRLQYLNRHGVQDVKDLSFADRLPVIVVIIDEFARLSDVLQHEYEYQRKMTRLLQTGRKPGLKFIFASQNYNNGIHGLRDEAKAQIQNRIALMNPNRGEMIGVLSMSMTDQVEAWINELPAYYSIVKFTDKQTGFLVKRIRNFYPSPTENPLEGMIQLSEFMKSEMTPLKNRGDDEPKCYTEKSGVYLDGRVPMTFDDQLRAIESYEDSRSDDILPGDVCIYPGTPRGFYPDRYFKLIPKPYQNILVTGGGGNSKNLERIYASLIASLVKSYKILGHSVEVWSDDRDPVYYRYHDFWRVSCFSDEASICRRIKSLLETVQKNIKQNKLVIILGYDSLKQAFARAGEIKKTDIKPIRMEMDLMAMIAKEKEGKLSDADFQNYNREAGDVEKKFKERKKENSAKTDSGSYDASSDIEKLWSLSGNMGLHFALCCPDYNTLERLRVRREYFVHQIIFDMPASTLRTFAKEQSDLLNLEGSVGYYHNNTEGYSFKTHLYPGIPVDGWYINEDGMVCEE